MNESTPNIQLSDVIKKLTRLAHPDRWSSVELSNDTRTMMTNTSSALNLIKAFVQQYGQPPEEWGDGYQESRFAFVKEEAGTIIKNERLTFATPAAFITELRAFYGLGDAQTAAEKRKAELQALIASRMPTIPEPIQYKTPPSSSPSPSPFRFKK
ncbi:hypothetical protein K2P47_05000 [Patescibacteria group bacterium]|nr:hypothetical protein [Patescibacteria group bacterium]